MLVINIRIHVHSSFRHKYVSIILFLYLDYELSKLDINSLKSLESSITVIIV